MNDKRCYVFIPHYIPHYTDSKTAVFTTLEALNARVAAALSGRSLSEDSRVAMNRIVEGSNTQIALLYTDYAGNYVGSVRVAEFQ